MKKSSLIPLIAIGLLFLFYIVIIFIIPAPANSSSKGVVTLTFDDGLESQYETAFKEMKKYGFNGTIYLLANWTGLFEGRELMNFAEAREMQEASWEIGSHGLNHKSFVNLSPPELDNELFLSKSILEKEGLSIASLSFPFGYFNELILNESKKAYSSARPLIPGYNDLDNFDPFKLKSKWVALEYSPDRICSWIEYAKSKGLWLILDFHSIEYAEIAPWDESVADFREILKCINNSKIEVKTINEAIEKNGKTI